MTIAKSVLEIVEGHLKASGYDGLYSPNNDCACRIGDLFPCGTEGVEQCRAGYLQKCDPETCNLEGECDWHIGEESLSSG